MNKAASAIGTAGLGFLLIWSGVTNAGVLSTVQHLFMGVAPIPGQPQSLPKFNATLGSVINTPTQTLDTGSGTASGSVIANAALKYEGKVPYLWGGKDANGWDCYGFLTYVLHHDLGFNLPNNSYMGYLEFLSWGQKYQISESEVQAGDIVIWPTHTGIAVSHTQMISAENPRAGTKVATFREGGPLAPEPMTFYRIKGALTA
jgi:cell wall-associated NlpC family hydrolase